MHQNHPPNHPHTYPLPKIAPPQIFLVKYPFQEVMQYDQTAATASIYSMPTALFYELHPFHLLLDDDCRLLQAGAALLRICPALAAGQGIAQHARIHHPSGVPWEYDAILQRGKASFLVLLRECMVTLKGQMVATALPDPAGGSPRRVMLFLGSPRCGGLAEMEAQRLYLSDIPAHDTTMDYVLLAEQRKSEADLKDRYERLAVELKVSHGGGWGGE
jgi:guanylate cyclase soluble subunit beta